MGPVGGASLLKRGRSGGGSAEVLDQQSSKTALDQEVGSIVKASVAPDSGGQILVVGGITQETPTPPFKTITQETPTPPIKTITQETSTPPVRTITQECAVSLEADQTSVWLPGDETVLQPETETAVRPAEKTLKHVFLSKTVIRPETCLPCGKRIRFGKMALKCRNCRSVAHPECRQNLVAGCSGTSMTGSSAQQDSLEGFAPATHPRVPRLIVECVAEIERRGLEERGLYRVPGGERLVKELRDRFLQGKTPLLLGKVQDVHVLCGLLKDFLRRLKEPLLTFRLHRTFMDASELSDEDNSTAIMYQAIAELPKANRETLAFLMLHLYKVTASPRCQMDQNNLARVFGPTIVGHGMAEPSPTTIMRDTNTQPKVICRLLSLPQAFWRRVLSVHNDHISSSNTETYSSQDQRRGQLFKPLTSPEMNSYNKTHVRGSVRQSRNHSNAFTTTTGRTEQGRKFFTSPS
ncbi:rac GTPase-activating protein 1 [Etheostoma spectabile]|uniref:rac GTPase-activating protein 1 n=1 Tax=Etheostoma spectabile TaxID=54343 RepID=UPI0013AFAA41|nr:rac GTPase-activating protein 1-like [Etheostoma spectabile]